MQLSRCRCWSSGRPLLYPAIFSEVRSHQTMHSTCEKPEWILHLALRASSMVKWKMTHATSRSCFDTTEWEMGHGMRSWYRIMFALRLTGHSLTLSLMSTKDFTISIKTNQNCTLTVLIGNKWKIKTTSGALTLTKTNTNGLSLSLCRAIMFTKSTRMWVILLTKIAWKINSNRLTTLGTSRW